MTFSEGLLQKSVIPYILLEIDQFQEQELFTAREAGIWCINLTLLTETELTDIFIPFTEDTYNKRILNVNSLDVTDNSGSTTSLNRVSAYSSLRTQDNSFHYDISTTALCITLDDWDPWYIYNTIALGLSLGYSQTTNTDGYTDENGIYYSARMTSVTPITETKDRIFFGSIQKNSLSAKLLNNDGDIDNLAASNIYGNPARLKGGFSLPGGDPPESTDLETLFQGRVSDIPDSGLEEMTIVMKDERSALQDPIPQNTYNSTDYSDVDADLENKRIQLVFGECRNVPCEIVNKEGSQPWVCKICDTDFDSSTHHDIKSIDQVYIDGEPVTESNASLVNATFELSSAQVVDGTQFKTVTADVKGYEDGSGNLYENPLEILELLIAAYLDQEYTSDNYNVSRWESSKLQVYDINLVVKNSTLENVIKDISTSCQGMFKIDRDGKYNFIVSNDDGGVVKAITKEEFLSDPSVKPRVDQVVSQVRGEYNREWNTNKARVEENTTYANEVYTNYRIRKEQSFKTLITDKADLILLLEEIMSKNKQIQPQYIIEIAHQGFSINLGDNVTAVIDRVNKEWKGNIKCEVEGISLDLQNLKTQLQLRFIETVPEDTTEYDQGYLYGDHIYGDRLYGDTGRS